MKEYNKQPNDKTLSVSNLLESGSLLPYSQPEIESVMRKIMLEQGITDVMYEGSNVSQLATVISYVIGSLNINTAINMQEAILPLASKRMNVLFGARQLGYEAKKQRAYRYMVTITPLYDKTKTLDNILGIDGVPQVDIIDTENQERRNVPLKQNTVFKSGEKTYYYKGPTIEDFWVVSNWDIQYKDDPTDMPDGSDSKYDLEYFYKDIEVVEGTLLTPEDDPSLEWIVRDYQDQDGYLVPRQDYLIPISNIEDDGIQVFVTSIDYDQAPSIGGAYPETTIERTKSNHFLVDETFSADKNKFVRMENIILQYPVIFFQHSGFGDPVNTGDKIRCNVFQTLGPNGVIEDELRVFDTVASDLFAVVNYRLLEVGRSEEDSDDIKENASVFNNTANRAVTKFDYEAVIRSSNLVEECVAWGGEDERPKQKGHIWYSTTPYSKFDWYRLPRLVPDSIDNPNFEDKPEYERYILDRLYAHRSAERLYNWYQSSGDDSNLFPGEIDSNSVKKITDYADYYKIMTMELHHRQPLYVDFDYYVDIVKYDMTKTKEEVNKSVFEGIKKYFLNDLQNFETDYLNSNLQRILDIILGYASGIGYEIETRGCLYRGMGDVHTEFPVCWIDSNGTPMTKKIEPGVIHCVLDFPFEDMYYRNDGDVNNPDQKMGYINPDLLPKIDTEYFGVEMDVTTGKKGHKLRVDYNVFKKGKPKEIKIGRDAYKETKIYWNGSIQVGSYLINNIDRKIELTFDFKNATDSGTGVVRDVTDDIFGTNDDTDPDNIKWDEQFAYFDIKYPFTTRGNVNMPFRGATKPRLRNVYFKDN